MIGLAALVVVPMVIALAVLRESRWYPSLELAQTEMHVRDVGTGHTPLTGLIGRLGEEGERGSHPGPLGFYVLAPGYRLLGTSAWALQAATAAVHVAAAGVAVWIAHRRGGLRLAVVMGVALLVLLRFLGAAVLTEPWNPYLPLLWWVVFLLAVWSVVERDLPLLPVAVISGSLCAQSHISYLGLVGGLGVGALVAVVVGSARRGADAAPRPTGRWLGVAAAVGVLLWVPPLLEELRDGRGNLSLLAGYFAGPGPEPLGFTRGLQLVTANLDPWRLVAGEVSPKVLADAPGWSVNGVAFLTVWAISAAVAGWLGRRSVLRLDAVVLGALVLGVVSTSRIFGLPWSWLLLWAWGLAAVMVAAITVTAAHMVDQVLGPPARRSMRWVATGLAAVLAVGSSAGLAVDAASVSPNDVATSEALATLVPETVDALERLPSGRGGRYLITWTDPFGVVGDLEAFGLANELVRAGLTVGFEPANRLRAAPHLTLDPAEATAVLRVVTGPAIAVWDERDDVRRLALHDPRTAEERALQERLRAEIDEELRSLGLAELIPQIDSSFVGAVFAFEGNPAVPRALIAKMIRATDLGTPSAIVLEPAPPAGPTPATP